MGKSVYSRFGATQILGPNQNNRRHIVRAGEHLPGIAAYELGGGVYGAEDWRQIAEENEIDDPDADVYAGRVLRIPTPQANGV